MTKDYSKNLIIASHNRGKIHEFKSLLSPYNIKIKSSSDLAISEVDEVGKSFEENAVIKVKSIPKNLFTLADDSGLCVSALEGKPGIYSARFASENGGWFPAVKEIYNSLKKTQSSDFSAKFVCCLAINVPNKKIFTYFGEVLGSISWPPRGKNGFGYDPFFIPKGYKKTFGEMQHQKKILIDHRFEAFKEFAKEHLNSI